MLVVDLDELGQLRLLDLDVDERVAVVVEDAEEPVDADVDARRLQERVVVRVDLDPPLGEQAGDRRVGEHHRGDSTTRGYRFDPSGAADIVSLVAVTRAIELRTEIPGPRSREITERKERVVADPLGLYLPIMIADGRGAIVTDVDGNSSSTSPAASAVSTSGTRTRASSRRCRSRPTRFLHTDFTIVPYEIYVEYAERLTAIAPFSGPCKAAFFNAGTEAVENAVKFARGYTRPAGRDRLRGRLPRPHAPLAHAHLEDASLQGGARAVRARGVPRPVPGRVPRDHGARRAGGARARALDAGRRRDGCGDRRRAGAGRGRLHPRAAGVHGGAARDLRPRGDPARRRRGADRLRPHRAHVRRRALRRRAGPARRREVDRRRPAALGASSARPRSWTRSGTTRSAARTSATPSRWPRPSPCSTCSRRRGSSSGRSASARRSARACSPGRSASTRSATSAGSARCSRSSTSRTARRRSPRRESRRGSPRRRPLRGLLLLKAGVHSNCNRVLCPLVITDAELEEGLAAWEEALEAVLA